MSQNPDPINELISSCQSSALHLEMRDVYGVEDEMEEFEAWRNGQDIDWDDRGSWWNPFHQAVSEANARGVTVRRARVISMPPTDYIRFEHAGTRANLAAGEDVRWLSRRQATDIALPGNDFWLFDEQIVYVNHFDGDGAPTEAEIIENAALAKLCSSAFEAVWERAVPHSEFLL